MAHKFRIGDNVHFIAGLLGRESAGGVYQIVRLLPSDGDEQQYREERDRAARACRQAEPDRAGGLIRIPFDGPTGFL